MISSVPPLLAQQIVASIKDVCGYDINFISTSGVIFASTNPARIGTFHEIGRQAAASGTAVEVRESHDFAGIQAGINVPVFHGERFWRLSASPACRMKCAAMPIWRNV